MKTLMMILAVLLMFEGAAHSFVLDSFELNGEAGILNPPDLQSAVGACGGVSVTYKSATSYNLGIVQPEGPRNQFTLKRSTWLTSVAQTEATTLFTLDEPTVANFTAELATQDSSGMRSDLYCRVWEVGGADLFVHDEALEWIVNPKSTLARTLFIDSGSYGFFCSAVIANENSLPDDFATQPATGTGYFDVELIAVPEPTMMMGLGSGVLLLVGMRRARNR